VTAALYLPLASFIVGLATGLFFRVWALLLISPMITILAAVVLQTADFGFWTGIPVIVACLVVNQIAYLLASFARHRGLLSAQDEVDGSPGERGEHDVRGQDE
jgi:hypothetical protein